MRKSTCLWRCKAGSAPGKWPLNHHHVESDIFLGYHRQPIGRISFSGTPTRPAAHPDLARSLALVYAAVEHRAAARSVGGILPASDRRRGFSAGTGGYERPGVGNDCVAE